jgi:hypothetical protein
MMGLVESPLALMYNTARKKSLLLGPFSQRNTCRFSSLPPYPAPAGVFEIRVMAINSRPITESGISKK